VSTMSPRYWHRRSPDRGPSPGFTLIELLVVLAILALLAALVTPQVLKYLARARVDTTHLQIEHLSMALDLFQIDVHRYPTTDEGLGALAQSPVGATKWSGPYLKKADTLVDPWGHPYVYRSPGQHGEFDLYSLGPEGGSGSDSQIISNW
jgi:general secretion pathway protein G